jgi:hypothetical protein
LTNGILASVILTGGGAGSSFDGTNSRTSVYMLVVLGECCLRIVRPRASIPTDNTGGALSNTVFVAATAAFRFLGSTIYLVLRLFGA